MLYKVLKWNNYWNGSLVLTMDFDSYLKFVVNVFWTIIQNDLANTTKFNDTCAWDSGFDMHILPYDSYNSINKLNLTGC